MGYRSNLSPFRSRQKISLSPLKKEANVQSDMFDRSIDKAINSPNSYMSKERPDGTIDRLSRDRTPVAENNRMLSQSSGNTPFGKHTNADLTNIDKNLQIKIKESARNQSPQNQRSDSHQASSENPSPIHAKGISFPYQP